MNRTKKIITVSLAIIMGFILGFFVSGRLVKNRMKHVHNRMESPDAEHQFLARKLQLSNEQLKDITPILDSMLPIQVELRHRHRQQMKNERKAMFEEIKPYLSEDQLAKMRELRNRKRGPGIPPPPRG
ncbi:MAG: hypothetical protein ACPGTP_10030 [Bacteroidia bacterium]